VSKGGGSATVSPQGGENGETRTEPPGSDEMEKGETRKGKNRSLLTPGGEGETTFVKKERCCGEKLEWLGKKKKKKDPASLLGGGKIPNILTEQVKRRQKGGGR